MTRAPYGTWTSPVTAQTVAAGALRLGGVSLDGENIYWIEGRPDEGGRNVVVRRTPDGLIRDATPAGTNVRTRVHEYGGGAYVISEETIYYSEFTDQRLYKLAPHGTPQPLTTPGDWFFADCTVDPLRPRLACVREDHSLPGRDAVTTLVSVPVDGPPTTAGTVVVSGHDFYACPRFSPDGTHLLWLAWRHPEMPWDGTELWVAAVAPDGTILEPAFVAGGRSESIFQPGWSPDGEIYFVSDRSGWWNLYRRRGSHVEAVHPMAAEFGRPLWQLGTSTWAFADRSRLIVSYAQQGRWRLATIDVASSTFSSLAAGVEPADTLAATSTYLVTIGGSATDADAVVLISLVTGAVERLRAASAVEPTGGFYSIAEAVEFPTDGGRTAHAFYYGPRNHDFLAEDDDLPPLLVISHGGPTAATQTRLNLEVQYWTSRGFAVVDVNYGGSTGYGRAYRQRLQGQWGVVDVADCINAAKFLAAQGKADPRRLAIRGRSAGGYATLAALTFHPDVFSAGTSYYGVGDLELLARETHKFESRYLDGLIGPYPAARDLYRARSPIHSVGRMACPLLLFQGLDDHVVPPDQAIEMAAAVRAKGLPVALITFEGEQHGFRQAGTIVRCLEIELFFYGSVFGFTPAGQRPEFTIDNAESNRADDRMRPWARPSRF
ncbi:MAG: peptidase [Blastocatellia bacterium]|nr:MAG: peptidase [Blastocatellia bacterium]